MNLRKFKEIVSVRDGSKEDLKLFRTWCENCYVQFCKDIELCVADDRLMTLNDTDDYEKKLRNRLEGVET